MKCPTCETENREGARFCRRCGTALAAPVAPAGEKVPEAAATPAAEAMPEAAKVPAAGPEPSPADAPPAAEPAVGADEAELPAEAELLAQAPATPAEERSDEEAAGSREASSPEPEAPVAEPPSESPAEAPPSELEAEANVVAEVDADTFWREPPPALEPLPPGTILIDRYALGDPLDVQEQQILYQAHDLQRCWQCGFDGNAPSEAFCTRCGASLDHKPTVRLVQVATPDVAPAGGEQVAAHLEHEGHHFLLLAEPLPSAPVEHAASVPRLLYGQRSVPGQVRELNEDSILTLTLAPVFQSETRPLVGLFAVADGMGGHEGGEIASKLALQVLAEHVIRDLILPALAGDVLTEETMLGRLRLAVAAANDAVYLARQKRDTDMGTTLTVLLIWDARLLVAHVGDCRAFRWSPAGLEQLTVDHSVVATMVASGQITPDELYTHPHRSVVTRSIGDKPSVKVDTGSWPLAGGDRLIVCSDGVWEMIRNEGIQDALLAEADPQAACDLLASRANAAGGEDNISVIVVQFETT